MFTGIIEEVGRLKSFACGAVEINCSMVLDGLKVGDSISTNGICLTVTAFDDRSFRANVMPETIRRTSLDGLKSGAPINLERALRVGDRLGGHIVSGHIDGVGRIISIRAEGNAHVAEIEAAQSLLRQIVEKGSIALDGMSLTVVGVSDRSFGVSLIPHTMSVTNFGDKRVGSTVNIETDLIAKYIERLMQFGASTPKGATVEHPTFENSARSRITRDFLIANGF